MSTTDKGQVIGSIFRGVLNGASWLRLVHWCKSSPGRSLTLQLTYPDGEANWNLVIDGETFEASTLEGVIMRAMVKLGPVGR